MIKKLMPMLVIMTILFSGGVFAEYLENEVIGAYDGRLGTNREFMIVNLIMNGEDVIPDVPGILYELDGATRTLLPVRVISDKMGASVDWNGQTQEVTILYEGKEIILTINSPYALVNGVRKELPDGIAPVIIEYLGNGRTLVPARFISEEFGMDVEWVQETRSVIINKEKQQVSEVYFTMANRFPQVRIKTSGEVKTSDFYLEKPDENDELIVDIINTELSGDFRNAFVPINLLYYDSIRVSSYEKGTRNTRLAISLQDTRGYDIFYDQGAGELVIQFINSVDLIYTEEIYGVDAVVIHTQEEPAYNISFLGNKIIVDVMNSLLGYNEGDYGSESSDSDLINTIAYSQFDAREAYGPDEKVSRIVINLNQNTTPEEVYVEHQDHNIYVYIAGDPLNGFDYYKIAQDTSQLSLTLEGAGQVTTRELAADVLRLEVADHLISIEALEILIDDGIIEDFDISKSSGRYLIDIAMAKNTTYEVLGNGSKSLYVNFFNIDLSNSKYKDTLIVIDPGHGGNDPGAIGYSGTHEKVQALRASYMLLRELEKEGFKVYLTRSNDQYINLYERANLANEIGADLFISMHLNAHTKTSVKGVEVLYSPYSSKGSSLATSIQTQLVRTLGAINRGIVPRPNLIVLRETKMPAALVEIGFLSNPDEEKLLLKDSYLNQAATAIKNGIINFLD